MKHYFISSLLLLVVNFSFGQIGVNNPLPDTTSILDLKSNKLGVLIPRMTLFERRNIGNPNDPANGLMVYDTDEAMLYYFDSTYTPTGADGQAWTAVNPLLFRDDNFTTIGQTHLRDVYTHSSVQNIGIATQLPKSKLSVVGNLSIGTNAVAAPANGLVVDGDVIANSDLTVTNTVTAKDVTATTLSGDGVVPVGAIIMWRGTTVPDDSWVICDGTMISDLDSPYNNQNSPDLKGRFIVGQGSNGMSSYTINTSAGTTSHSHTVNSHDHSVPELSYSGTTSSASGNVKTRCSCIAGDVSGPGHTHTYSGTTVANTSGTRSPGTNSQDHIPPYYVLAYIMRIK